MICSFMPMRFRIAIAAAQESALVQMIWGERRGHGIMGAVQRLPMELTHVATFSF
jgi:hypothetical protein